MLKQRSEFFQSLMMLNDLFFLSVAWWFAYVLRFETDFFPEPEPHVLPHYIIAWLIILIVWTAVFHWLDFYRPRRLSGQNREIVEVLKGCSLAMLIFLGVLFLLRGVVLSRIVVLFFGVSSFIVLNLSHVVFREGLRFLRRRGYNLRHVLLIGTPRQVDQLLHKLRAYRQFGLNIAGVYLTQQAPPEMTPVPGGCLKDTAELNRLVKSGTIDQIFVTLPLEQAGKLVEIQQWLDDEPITLHFIPERRRLSQASRANGGIRRITNYQFTNLTVPRMELDSQTSHGSVNRRACAGVFFTFNVAHLDGDQAEFARTYFLSTRANGLGW